jgi:hypothetical protein
MNRDEAMKRSDEALQELASALKQGKSEALVRYLDMLSRFHRYSFGNCMLIAIQRPDATLVAGFHRWKELGRFVRKGESGIGILAPLVVRKREIEELPDDEPESPQRNGHALTGFRVVHVFDVSQTEGRELPEFTALSGDPGEAISRVEDMIQRHGIELTYVDGLGGALGMSEGGKISILSSLAPAESFATLVHELAHELLHRGDRRQATTKVIRETEAEAVAFVVTRAVGLQGSTRSADYIQLWNGDESVLMQSLELIRSVSSQILLALECPTAEAPQEVLEARA